MLPASDLAEILTNLAALNLQPNIVAAVLGAVLAPLLRTDFESLCSREFAQACWKAAAAGEESPAAEEIHGPRPQAHGSARARPRRA